MRYRGKESFIFVYLFFQVKKKFNFLCAIIRISVVLWQHRCMNCPDGEHSYSCEGFKLVPKFNLALDLFCLNT